MNQASKRSTIYFDPQLHRALRLKAAHAHRTVSDIVNDAVRAALPEDQEDLSAFEERVSEPTMSNALKVYVRTRVRRAARSYLVQWRYRIQQGVYRIVY